MDQVELTRRTAEHRFTVAMLLAGATMGFLKSIRQESVLFRFSLYGFLKNQDYFEPFWILAFRQKGLSFFTIGLLIAIREITMNILEVPSGAIADVVGRRVSMVFSFLAYIAAFLLFGSAQDVVLLALGMVFFGIGEAFRTGTHKSMIFAWLRVHGRLHEKTKIYGYTRSWSKIGSAVSVILASAFVIISDDYVSIFYLSVIPYAINIVNFLGYPKEVDSTIEQGSSLRRVARVLIDSLRVSATNAGLRRVLLESMGFEGVFKAIKDYLQPIVKATAIPLTLAVVSLDGFSDAQRAALLACPVYFVLNLLSAWASREAHRFSELAGGHELASRRLWLMQLITFVIMIPCLFLEALPIVILGFVILNILQNFWGPIMYSRLDDHAPEDYGSTVLSIESQSVAIATMVLAPVLGWAVDSVQEGVAGASYWPVALVGLVVSAAFFGSSSGRWPFAGRSKEQ